MAAYASFVSSTPRPLPLPLRPFGHRLRGPFSLCHSRLLNNLLCSRSAKTLTVVSSSSSFAESSWKDNENLPSKKSILSKLIHEIEPLDVSFIQKDVSPTSLDAMKRTISGMLGLLPSDQFQVLIEALWEPLCKLLISSMMTGYTLRNAEYRLFLETNLDIHEENDNKQKGQSDTAIKAVKSDDVPVCEQLGENGSDDVPIQGFGGISLEAQQYILSLQTRLLSVKKELHEVKRKSAALQMQKFVGEEKNDLLDYLRSLQPEKVAELSEPTCPELKEAVHSVVHGLLATLSSRMHSKAPHLPENMMDVLNVGAEEVCFDMVQNPSLQFQPLVSLTRDYLARLLFWCMLLGHYLRGLEYRLELMELLSLPSGVDSNTGVDDQSA